MNFLYSAVKDTFLHIQPTVEDTAFFIDFTVGDLSSYKQQCEIKHFIKSEQFGIQLSTEHKADSQGHISLHCKKNYEITGFFLLNLPGTGLWQIISGQGEFDK